jgi:hypothetical protein
MNWGEACLWPMLASAATLLRQTIISKRDLGRCCIKTIDPALLLVSERGREQELAVQIDRTVHKQTTIYRRKRTAMRFVMYTGQPSTTFRHAKPLLFCPNTRCNTNGRKRTPPSDS